MRTELKVQGMTCSHCESAVARALRAVPGVVAATVDLAAAKAIIEGDAQPSRLVEAVVEEGYTAQVVV